MVKKCEVCGKPLTEFETAFHKKANSPVRVSCKCWSCSDAEHTFENACIDKPHHKKEILVCIIACMVIIAALLPVLPHWNEPATGFFLKFYAKAVAVIYLADGTVAALSALSRRKKKPDPIRPLDPPEQRYHTSYGQDTVEHVTKKRWYDDAYVTEKVIHSGTEVVDQWNWDGKSANDSKLDRVTDGYATMLSKVIMLALYVFVGCLFGLWVIPYILIVSVMDHNAKQAQAEIPRALQKAYKSSRADVPKSPLTYRDKVGFLISKENCAKAKTKTKSQSFLANYTGEDETKPTRLPFFYNKQNGVSFMIVDYHKPEKRAYGITFVLLEGHRGIEKKMVLGDEFIAAEGADWKADWKENGATPQIIGNIEWYEEQFRDILKSSKKNQEILG